MVGRRYRGQQQNGHEAVVKLLLENGVELETKDDRLAAHRCHRLQRADTRRLSSCCSRRVPSSSLKTKYGRTPLSRLQERT